MRIVFFGTPSFAAQILQHLYENNVNIVAVVTRPDKPKGRTGAPQYSAVKQYACACMPHIPIYQPEKASDTLFMQHMQGLAADLFVVAAYGQIMRQIQ